MTLGLVQRVFLGGYRQHKVVTGAGNAAKTLTPGSGVIWNLLWLRATYAADATVATRQYGLQLDDGTNITCKLGGDEVTASQTRSVDYGREHQQTVTAPPCPLFLADRIGSLPNNVILMAGDRIYAPVTTNGVAGDTFTIRAVVMELKVS